MAVRQSMPRQGNSFAAGAAILVLFAWSVAPISASASTASLCGDVAFRTAEVPDTELKAQSISHDVDTTGASNPTAVVKSLSPDHSLAPRIEAALRKVFNDTTTPVADSEQADDDEPPAMITRVPGISDQELARYRRQMYRTDI